MPFKEGDGQKVGASKNEELAPEQIVTTLANELPGFKMREFSHVEIPQEIDYQAFGYVDMSQGTGIKLKQLQESLENPDGKYTAAIAIVDANKNITSKKYKEAKRVVDKSKIDRQKTEDEIKQLEDGQHVMGELKEALESLARFCSEFSDRPMIFDSLNDSERSAWRDEKGKQYGVAFDKFFKRNKLTINSLLPVVEGVHSLLKLTKNIKSPKIQEFVSIAKEIPQDLKFYYYVTLEEKVIFVEKIDNLCRKFLQLIGKE